MGPIAPVLHVDTERTWRGGQQQVAYLAEGLHRRGVPTAVACPPRSSLARHCSRAGIQCVPVPMCGELDVIAGARIAQICRRRRFGIVHLHSGHAVTLGIWAKALVPSLRLVVTRRVDFPIGRNVFSRMKYSTRLLDRIVCISEAIRDLLIADGISPERLVVIPSGVDLDRFARVMPSLDLRHALGIPGDHVVVGTVAAMAGHKDYPTLLEAAAEVVHAENHVTFCAVGDGPMRSEIEARARRLGLGRRFVFCGFQDDVGAYLRLFDVFVLASRTEGLGSSLLDALAVGLPVVATRAGGIPEIVSDGINGLLVPPSDPAALARAILTVIRDRDLRERLRANARSSVERFDIAHTVASYVQLYAELSEGK